MVLLRESYKFNERHAPENKPRETCSGGSLSSFQTRRTKDVVAIRFANRAVTGKILLQHALRVATTSRHNLAEVRACDGRALP
jgi:hypothetical protein